MTLRQRTVFGRLLPVIYHKKSEKSGLYNNYSGAFVYSDHLGLALARRNPDAEQDTKYSRPNTPYA